MSRRRRAPGGAGVGGWTEPLYTAEEIRAAEARYGGATIELMERAGRATADVVAREYPNARSISVWCGTGANGGDGFVVARLLREAGRDVDVVLLGSEDRVRGDAAENLRRAREAGVPFVDAPAAPDVVVDALFGTGFSGAPRREAAERIQALNDVAVPVISVDVPSGVDASTGEVAGAAIEATKTVTFHAPKVGLVVAPGRFHAGEVEVADIGVEETQTRHRRVTADVLELVPRRGPRDNKYSAGSVLVVGGSRGMTGALVLAAEAAFRAGAGYVRVCFPAALETIVEAHLVEAVKTPCACDEKGRFLADAADAIVRAAARAGAVALGTGLGRSDETRELVRRLLERLDVPLVLDADALWAVAEHHEWVFSRHAPTVLTPHEGELARLLGRESAWVAARRLRAATEAADDLGATILLKGADTIVAAPGRPTLVCDLGNPGLATAGSGDVLTGIATAFLAKRMEREVAAGAAAAAGGAAAMLAAERVGTAGMIARDVVEALSPVLSR